MDASEAVEARIRAVLASPTGLRGIPIPELNGYRRAVAAATSRPPAGFEALAAALANMLELAEAARDGGLTAEDGSVLSVFLATAAGNLPETVH